jgi:uncharacterized membrane protein (UPF0136 family)
LAARGEHEILRESHTLFEAERNEVEDVRELDEGVPAAVGFAALIGLGKAIFEAGFGLLGLAVANSIDDSFGGGILVFGILFAIASLLLWRGSRAGYYLTVVLSALGLVVAVIYLFRSEDATFGATLVSAFFNAVVLYLLLGRKSVRAYFAR